MSRPALESPGSGPGGALPDVYGMVKPRPIRRVIRGLIWAGLILLVIGLIFALLAQGPSVPATILLSAGLLAEVAGLLGYRFLFWAGIYAKDRPKTAGRMRKPGP